MDPTTTLYAPTDAEVEERYGDLLAELGRSAARFRFRVAPNPCVGAAVIGVARAPAGPGLSWTPHVVSRGFHEDWGGPHAEIHALEAAAASGVPAANWDTLVVTLEPCSTFGKTPPCTDAILRSGIRRVVVGALDPDPRHRGRSLEALHAAGLEVVLLPGHSPLETVSPHFRAWTDPDRLRRAFPWTIAKWAQTRTGQLTPPEDVGGGRWISGPSARSEVHALRGRVDAVVTGIGTVLHDDPRLTVRAPGDLSRPPLRVVLDSHLRTPPGARLLDPIADPSLEAGGAVHVLALPGPVAARHRALLARGAEVHAVRASDDGHLSLPEVHRWLFDRGARRVLLEAGPKLLEAHFVSELVDQIAVYTGNINGGRGPSLASWLRPPHLAQIEHREVGEDAVLEAFYDLS